MSADTQGDARWDDDHCPQSQNSDGSHCAHADTHDVCDWCGARWGEGGAMTVPIEPLRGAVGEIDRLRRLVCTCNAYELNFSEPGEPPHRESCPAIQPGRGQ